jgi:hypothetical protein
MVAVASNHLHGQQLSSLRKELIGKDKNRETAMGAVMVKCPQTGRDIPTGIVTERARFEATPVFFARVHCPICRTEHEWFAKNAWVCEDAPKQQRRAA